MALVQRCCGASYCLVGPAAMDLGMIWFVGQIIAPLETASGLSFFSREYAIARIRVKMTECSQYID